MNYTKKKRNGFTLAELLIVVAIIAVLVAVSIPIFTGQIDKARASTDMANVRAAKAATVTEYMDGGESSDTVTYYYNAESGKVTTDASAAAAFAGYGKSKKAVSNSIGIPNENGTSHIVSIQITSDGTPTAYWVLGAGSNSGSSNNPAATVLGAFSKSSWQQYVNAYSENGKYGVLVPSGTIMSEGSDYYLFYFNSGFYPGDQSNTSLANIYTKSPFAGCVLKITDKTTIYTEESYKSTFENKTVPAGTIVYYNGKYLVQTNTHTYNANATPKPNDDNWKEIKGI